MTIGPSPHRGRGRRLRRTIIVVVVILILAPLVAIGVFVARFDPNSYKPEIAAAVARALGRKLSLNGPLSLGLSFTPVISAQNVALANPPGFSRPEMAALSRLDARVALLPLLSGRIEIQSLSLIRPDIAVEIDRAGESNFALAPASRAAVPAPPAGHAAPSQGRARPVTIEVRQLAITDGKLSWRDDRTGRHGVLLVRSLTAFSEAGGTRLAITMAGSYGGLDFTMKGTSGPLARLVTPGAGPAWPIALSLASGPAVVKLSGSFTDPAAAQGYHLAVHANLPVLAALAPLVPGIKLPPLNGIVLSADLADVGRGRPEVNNLSLAAGPSDLGALRPGLKLASFSLVAPGLDQPCKLTLAGTFKQAPFKLTATLGPPASLLPPRVATPPAAAPAASPWPVAIRAMAAGADLSVSGTMTRPARLSGANLALSAQIPELAKLSPFAGFALPALSPMTVSGQIADAPSGWRQWIRLSALTSSAPAGDLEGDATLSLAGARPAISAALTAKQLDLDLVRKAFEAVPPAAHGVPAKPAAPAAPVPAHGVRLIPDTPLPFAALKTADADLSFAVGHLVAYGAQYANVAGKFSLKDGKLVLAPFAADAPAGHVQLTASADGAEAKPAVAMTLEAPSLALAPLLASFGMPARATGTIAVRADFTGAGHTPHAIATGLTGRLGIAMAGGSVDRSILGDLFGPALQRARVPSEILGQGMSPGTSEVRCLAVRIDAAGGTGTLNAGLLEMTGLTLTGSGNFWLGPETLGLRMVPTLAYRDSALSLPVKVEGTFLAPKVAPEPAATARSAAGVAGGLISPKSGLGRFLSALSGSSAPREPDCGPALALARFGAPGPAAPPASAIAPAGPAPVGGREGKPAGPLNLLRGLFR
ncbi:MAG: AsmA family protein [Acetobacteraceae bacterium]